jgi:branched-chain amino acid transport system substrate-binding protein
MRGLAGNRPNHDVHTYVTFNRGERRNMRFKWILGAAAVCLAVALAGCGSSSSSSTSSAGGGGGGATSSASSASSSTAAAGGGASVLGAPKAATGTPVVFGAINNETNAGADFPESRQAADAMVSYLNAYKSGLDGHPIKIVWCITDGTPATSGSCAKRLIADHPVAILGSTDLADAVTIPAYKAAKLAYLGGMNFTPVENTASNAVIFNDTAQLGNVLGGLYAAQHLGGKKVAVLALGDTQGEFTAKTFWLPAIAAGGGQAKLYPAPPSQADLSSIVESAISSSPDVVGLESPSQCVALLTALKSAGWTKPVISIDTCSAPVTIKAAGGAAEGMYWFQPFQLSSTGTADAKLADAILAKYAPAKLAVDSPSLVELSTVMDIWRAFHATPPSKLTTTYILKTLRSGSNHPNFLAEPYTCNGKAIPAYSAVCNAKYYLYQVKNGAPARIGSSTYDQGTNLIH